MRKEMSIRDFTSKSHSKVYLWMLGTAHRNHRILFEAESKWLWRVPGDGRDDRSIVHTGHVSLGPYIIFANHNHVQQDFFVTDHALWIYAPKVSEVSQDNV